MLEQFLDQLVLSVCECVCVKRDFNPKDCFYVLLELENYNSLQQAWCS